MSLDFDHPDDDLDDLDDLVDLDDLDDLVERPDGRWDGYIATRDDDIDVSEAFWAGTREWSSSTPRTHAVPAVDETRARPRVQRDRSGPISRTRSHRVVTPGDAVESVNVPLERRDEVVGDDRRHRAGGLVDRLGLGRVDPRIVRIGVIVAIFVLLVPLLLALRPKSPQPSVTTGSPAASGAAQAAGIVALAAAAVAEVTPALADAGASAAEPAQQPEATPTVIDPSTLPRAPIINPDAGTTGAVMETSASGAMPAGGDDGGVAEAAQTDVPAARVARPCPEPYTVRQGDYWLRLADGADVALVELLQLNGATVDTPLYPGSEICLPQDSPAPATNAAPAPTTTAPPYVWVDEAKAQAIIREVWPDDLEEQALRVAERESKFDVTAKNYCCYGLFQIYWSLHRGWLDDLGITSAEQLFDARLNATAALNLYIREGGWGPWS
jgi:LysM domain